MDEINPAVDPAPPSASQEAELPKLPTFLMIIGLIHVILAVSLILVVPISAMKIKINGSEMSGVLKNILALVIVLFFGASGFGLFLRQKWAWWLTAGLYCFFTLSFIVDPINTRITGISKSLTTGMITGFIVFGLLLWYLMSKRVWAYFQFQKISKLRALII